MGARQSTVEVEESDSESEVYEDEENAEEEDEEDDDGEEGEEEDDEVGIDSKAEIQSDDDEEVNDEIPVPTEPALPPFNTSDSPIAPLKSGDEFERQLDGLNSTSAQLGKAKQDISDLISDAESAEGEAESADESENEKSSLLSKHSNQESEDRDEEDPEDPASRNSEVITSDFVTVAKKRSPPLTVSERAAEFGIEFFVIRHAEATNNVTGLIGGRAPWATLTEKGQEQSVTLGSFLKDRSNIRFDFVYSSTLERARETADIVCKELGFPVGSIQLDDRLQELSQGEWEGKPREEIYTPEVRQKMTNGQPDFRPPAGESQRQVESRMIDSFLSIIEEARDPTAGKSKSQLSQFFTSPFSRASLPGSGETNGDLDDDEDDDEDEDEDPPPVRIAVFSHGSAIKCLLRGVLQSDPRMTYKMRIDNTSVTVLRYLVDAGWHLDKVNDVCHLVLDNVTSE